jgi:hypothetical protein
MNTVFGVMKKGYIEEVVSQNLALAKQRAHRVVGSDWEGSL